MRWKAAKFLRSCNGGRSVTVSAHFDGKVIVPDEPLDLPPNQALILQIQPVGGNVGTRRGVGPELAGRQRGR
jgi:hypothetical protein